MGVEKERKTKILNNKQSCISKAPHWFWLLNLDRIHEKNLIKEKTDKNGQKNKSLKEKYKEITHLGERFV
jgi:hypothetical protein